MINVYKERGLAALYGIVVAEGHDELMIIYNHAPTDHLWMHSQLFGEKDMFFEEDGQIVCLCVK